MKKFLEVRQVIIKDGKEELRSTAKDEMTHKHDKEIKDTGKVIKDKDSKNRVFIHICKHDEGEMCEVEELY